MRNVSSGRAVSMLFPWQLLLRNVFPREIPDRLKSECFPEKRPLEEKEKRKKQAKNVKNGVSSQGREVGAGCMRCRDVWWGSGTPVSPGA